MSKLFVADATARGAIATAGADCVPADPDAALAISSAYKNGVLDAGLAAAVTINTTANAGELLYEIDFAAAGCVPGDEVQFFFAANTVGGDPLLLEPLCGRVVSAAKDSAIGSVC